MRLSIQLQPEADQNLLGKDIQFMLPKVIRFLLSKTEKGKALQEQTLDQLLNYNLKFFPNPREYNNTLIVGKTHTGKLTLSSYSEQVIDALNDGVLKTKKLLIQNHAFKITEVERLDEVVTVEQIKVRPMFPILSGKIAENQRYPFYFKWNHSEFIPALEESLKKSYETLCGPIEDEHIQIKFDKNYLKFNKKISKLVVVHKRTQRAIWAPLYLSGSPKLVQFALDMGLGLNRELGYGMIERYNPKDRKKSKHDTQKPKRPDLDKLPDNFGNLMTYYNQNDTKRNETD